MSDETTARPWRRTAKAERGQFVGANGHIVYVDALTREADADAALIVAAVNDYDRLRRIEEAARAVVDTWNPIMGNVVPPTLNRAIATLEGVIDGMLAAPQQEAKGTPRSERDRAIELANRVLDRPSADPDDDLAILSRQLLRAVSTIRSEAGPLDVERLARADWRTTLADEGRVVLMNFGPTWEPPSSVRERSKRVATEYARLSEEPG